MAEVRDWQEYGDWHELLDALCVEEGHLDNLVLAERLCAASGNHTRSAFETAVKNLRNWRAGVHLPQRKNFALLGRILKVDRDEGLRQRWNALYRVSRSRPSDAEPATQPEKSGAGKWKIGWVVAAGLASVAAIGIGATFFQSREQPDPVGSYEGIIAEYVRNVSVRVGDSMIIHGARGDDCGPAPSWEETMPLLPPPLVTGTLSDGGVGTRFSRQCGGRVPARAVLFTATGPGTEQITLYGDEIVIRVSQ